MMKRVHNEVEIHCQLKHPVVLEVSEGIDVSQF